MQWDELPGTQEDEEPTALMHELRLGIHGVDILPSPSLHGPVIDRPAIWCKSQPVPKDLAPRASLRGGAEQHCEPQEDMLTQLAKWSHAGLSRGPYGFSRTL